MVLHDWYFIHMKKTSVPFGIYLLFIPMADSSVMYEPSAAEASYTSSMDKLSSYWQEPEIHHRAVSFYSREIALQKAIEALMESGNYTVQAFLKLLMQYFQSDYVSTEGENQTTIVFTLPTNLLIQYGQGGSKGQSGSQAKTSETPKSSLPSKNKRTSSTTVNDKEYTITVTEYDDRQQLMISAIEHHLLQPPVKIGEGETSTVYRVNVDGKNYALKKSRMAYHQALKQEALQMLDLDHPNILKIYALAYSSNETFLLMEYCPQDLWGILFHAKQGHTPQIGDALGWLSQILSGLSYLHTSGLVHDDIKVENIFLTEDNTIVIADFGFMGITRSRRTRSRNLFTAAYSDPYDENRSDFLSYTTDIWSLGILITLLLAPERMAKILYPEFHRARKPHPSEIWEKTVAIAHEANAVDEFEAQLGLDLGGIKNNADLPDKLQWLKLSQAALLHGIANFCLRKNPHKRPSAEQLFDLISTYTALAYSGEA